jgi:hypothetical protein
VAPGSMNGNYLFTAPGITQPGIVYGSLTSPAQTIPVQTGAPVSYNQPIQPTTMPVGPRNQY